MIDKQKKNPKGRPAMDPDEKRKGHHIKVTNEEWKRMQDIAEAAGISVAELIRRSVLGAD